MTLENFSREFYEYFYEKIYNRKSLTTRDKHSEEVYKQFIIAINKRYDSVGLDFLWFYVTYQFARFSPSDFKPNKFVKEVGIENVFGKRAQLRYEERRSELDDLTKKSPFLFKHNINKEDFVTKTHIPFTLQRKSLSVARHEMKSFQNPVKALAVNTEFGFEICIDQTDLYNDEDKACKICNKANECKVLLKEIYPHLYKLKGYE